MRVGLITNLYPPFARGGAERVVEEEVRALKAQGHDVFVVTAAPLPESGDASVRTVTEMGVRIHRFYPMNLFFYGDIGRHGPFARAVWHLWDMLNVSSARAVRDILKREKPEVVHTHNLKGIGLLVPRAIRALGMRHVHTLHDVQLAVPSGLIIRHHEDDPLVGGAPARLYAAAVRMLFGSPDAVISPSRYLLKFYGARGFFPRSKKIILPNPAPEARQTPNVKRQTSPATRFLFLGQVERHKGVMLLITAFKRLLAQRPEARLEIVGTGAGLRNAEALAGGEMRITFYGKKGPVQFAELFGEADFTVVPSICYENAPTVVLESFAHGVPVIAADIGGAAELVREGRNGFVFPAADLDGLIAVMKKACDAKDRETLSQTALRSAAPLMAAHHAQRLVDIYQGRDPGFAEEGPVVPIRYHADSRFSNID